MRCTPLSVPATLKVAVSVGIGLFICFIGLQNAHIVVDGATLVGLYSFRGSLADGSFSYEGITTVTASSSDATIQLAKSSCIIREHWVSLFALFYSLNGPERTDAFSFTMPELPGDIAAEIPIVVHGGDGYDGSVIMMAEVSGPVFSVPAPSYDAGGPYGTKFLKAFFVRGDNV